MQALIRRDTKTQAGDRPLKSLQRFVASLERSPSPRYLLGCLNGDPLGSDHRTLRLIAWALPVESIGQLLRVFVVVVHFSNRAVISAVHSSEVRVV
jgi:hypothetical protein